ncbi:hypothetical protein B0H14DRAFT_2559818 [Mycena olivaceomarginata]|nr:hypothetical protein B0H14DRAFT_2559818 [Mycena olivaceomarginata]
MSMYSPALHILKNSSESSGNGLKRGFNFHRHTLLILEPRLPHESRVKTGTKDVHVTRRVALWGLTTTSNIFSAFLAEVTEPKEKKKKEKKEKMEERVYCRGPNDPRARASSQGGTLYSLGRAGIEERGGKDEGTEAATERERVVHEEYKLGVHEAEVCLSTYLGLGSAGTSLLCIPERREWPYVSSGPRQGCACRSKPEKYKEDVEERGKKLKPNLRDL